MCFDAAMEPDATSMIRCSPATTSCAAEIVESVSPDSKEPAAAAVISISLAANSKNSETPPWRNSSNVPPAVDSSYAERVLTWFVGGAILAVWYVFRDPRFDLRLLAVGALIPDLIDIPIGRVTPAHSLLAAVGALTAVVVGTYGRKPWRRRWLALPIGMLLHLVLDGVVGSTRVFWWPFAGTDLEGRGVPSLDRGWWNVPLEIAGLAMLVWVWRRGGLSAPAARTHLCRTGQIVISTSKPQAPPPTC